MTTPTTAPWPDDPAAPPPGVPLGKWNRAVALVRAEAPTAASFWSLWTRCYPRFLRGHSDGRTFFALYEVFDVALGGRAPGPFDPGPAVAVDGRAVVEATPGRGLFF